ncbi:MAG TPA: hypothetical protein VFJ82_00445 [Longimicrobium sp.]|nr:hypothetical protein [Longimicrobium sp.]
MKRAWTTVAALLVAASAGCRAATVAAPAPEPLPAPPPPPARSTAPIIGDPIPLCVVKGGRITIIYPGYVPSSGDTTVNDRPWREAYPLTDEYLARAPWYVANEPIVLSGHRYVKYGLPRVLSPEDVVAVRTYRGVMVFAEPDADRDRPEVVYLPVHPSCEFQPYQISEDAGAVRG